MLLWVGFGFYMMTEFMFLSTEVQVRFKSGYSLSHLQRFKSGIHGTSSYILASKLKALKPFLRGLRVVSAGSHIVTSIIGWLMLELNF